MDEDRKTIKYQSAICEAASTCRATFDVEQRHLPILLKTREDVSTALECALVLHDNQPAFAGHANTRLQVLLCREQRLSRRLEPVLRQHIYDDRVSFDNTLSRLWPSYRPGGCITAASSAESRWVETHTSAENDRAPQSVHFNLLDGSLLINGKPLGRLPRHITTHATYIRTFGLVQFLTVMICKIAL